MSAPTIPGVFVEEDPGGVPAISGVATSIAAFVDTFRSGPLDQAIHLSSFADFERELGGLDESSEASWAIRQFFLNGGTEAYAVRVADPSDAALLGSRAAKTGLYALQDVDLFNILCLPAAAQLGADAMRATWAEAAAYCEERRAFLLVDPPPGIGPTRGIEAWLAADEALRHRNAAAYVPRVLVGDPLDPAWRREVGASGTMAGVYARTDAARGVWASPAGTEAVLRGVEGLSAALSDAESAALASLGVNSLRSFPVHGHVAWGARTLVGRDTGADQRAAEWKHVPVRRLALFLEESLVRGTTWTIFEPNEETLWARLRRSVGAFLQDLFTRGALRGRTPGEAFFVRCDAGTTTQEDIDRGVVNVVVGFAPLRPAEFVIIQIGQAAGRPRPDP